MKLNHIIELLSTICHYNTVRITQTFTSAGKDLITVRCLPDTDILELTYINTGETEQFSSPEEAAAVIELQISQHKVT